MNLKTTTILAAAAALLLLARPALATDARGCHGGKTTQQTAKDFLADYKAEELRRSQQRRDKRAAGTTATMQQLKDEVTAAARMNDLAVESRNLTALVEKVMATDTAYMNAKGALALCKTLEKASRGAFDGRALHARTERYWKGTSLPGSAQLKDTRRNYARKNWEDATTELEKAKEKLNKTDEARSIAMDAWRTAIIERLASLPPTAADWPTSNAKLAAPRAHSVVEEVAESRHVVAKSAQTKLSISGIIRKLQMDEAKYIRDELRNEIVHKFIEKHPQFRARSWKPEWETLVAEEVRKIFI